MKVDEIPVLTVEPALARGVKVERREGPEYVRKLIDELHAIPGLTSLQQLNKQDIVALPGGNMSVDYAIRADGKWVVVKLRTQGAEAEAEALRAWRKAGADVVEVYGYGVIPKAKVGDKAVKYLVLEAAINEQGELAQTAQEYLDGHPKEARPLGIKMGENLARMHRALAGRHSGEFGDMWGETDVAAVQTWNVYLMGYVDAHLDQLHELGLTDSTLERLKDQIMQMPFPERGVYLHGDYSSRNVLLVSTPPFEVKAIDPNPLVGHPSWDLAIIRNNLEFDRRLSEHAPKNDKFQTQYQAEKELWEGLRQGYRHMSREEITDRAIRVAQLMQCMYLLPGAEQRARKNGQNPTTDLDAVVARETLLEHVEQLTK